MESMIQWLLVMIKYTLSEKSFPLFVEIRFPELYPYNIL